MKCFSHRPATTPRYKTLVYSKHAHKLEQKVLLYTYIFIMMN